ncbi:MULTISPECIES: NTP/NDP exchange transporter [Hydrocarboniphaga]|uniref:MFS transporter n=1 Tax=Hydrocarboniphaga effusa AP103 TaxID=1172194 RepID=I7ZJX0_9GAMM|nr:MULTISPECIES: hypothetical protein [Hydrocarboniphaga]EIT72239.1 hypothetical protein WQQ_23760 [Hydrocarboniphaga effusa AP103]MDZ4079628.1 MFS transporter [Hydrocarboniphaga sp.]
MNRIETAASDPRRSGWSVLGLRRDEIGPVLVATLFFFCVLTALMLLRPARDALGMEHSLDSLRGLIVVTALGTLAVNPLFGWLVGRLTRQQLVSATYGFFVLSLVGFWSLMRFAPGAVGRAGSQAFFVWFNVFNLFVTLVFWALLTERFTREQGLRLFSLVSIGGTSGAIFGPWLTLRLAGPLGTANLLLVAGGFLLLGLLAAWLLLQITPDRAAGAGVATALNEGAAGRIGGSAWAGIGSVFRSPYLGAIACYVMLMAAMATFVYFARLQMVAAIAHDVDARAAMLGHIDLWTHIAVLVLQLSLRGRLVERFGLGVALAILPVATAIGFVGLAIHGSVAVLVLLEAITRAVQRGITQPAREALFTGVAREDQYKAKAFIDTFLYRSGDVVGAQAERALGGPGPAMGGLFGIALPLALAWVALALWLGRARTPAIDALAASGSPNLRCGKPTPGVS